MLPSKPPAWGIEAAAVDPRWQRIWRHAGDPQREGVKLPLWGENNHVFDANDWHDLSDSLDNTAWGTSPNGPVLELNGDPDLRSATAEAFGLDDPAFSIFMAMHVGANPTGTPGNTIGLVRGAGRKRGGWYIRLLNDAGSGVWDRFRLGVVDNAGGITEITWSGVSTTTGYISFLIERVGTNAELYVNGEFQSNITLAAGELGTVAGGSDATSLALGAHNSHTVGLLSAFACSGAYLTAEDARALHNDPWAWMRPAEVSPAIFGDLGGASGVTGTADLSPGAASVTASGAHGVAGTSALSPGAAAVAAGGAHGVTGAAAIAPAAAVVAASGAIDVVGTAVLQPGAGAVAASGTHTPPAAAITGTAVLVPAAARVQAWGLKITLPNLSGIGDAEILEVGVPYSVNSIINGALDLIASNGIASLSDSSSHVGNAIKRNFDVERDSLLREYPWNFAMRRTKLAASSKAPAFRFAHAYELPAGPDPEFCLRVWAVGDEESRQDSDVWEISGRRLLTDLEAPLPVRYIGRIVNPALWDPLTVKALEARLAWQAAYLASGSAALAEQMARIYQERLDAAKAIDAQEGTPEPFEDGTTWVDARLTGVTW